MKTLPILPTPVASSEACTGHCQGCGKMHIKIFGLHDAAALLLAERVQMAVDMASIPAKILNVNDPVAIEAHGIQALPALMMEGNLVLQGIIPSASEIVRLMKNKDLFKSKLFQLSTLSVAVDMSEASANALTFAWKMAERMGCNVEIVYAMDSIFEGSTPAASGFMSGYSKTMQDELDTFVADTMKTLGIVYVPPGRFAGEPSDGTVVDAAPSISSKVIYGAPDVALVEYSDHTDMMVMGSTGRGNLGKRLFGSVSAEVSKNAHCPVLYVSKDASYRGFDQLLYASDFDSLNPLSIHQATSFAQRFDAQIHFVHVGPGGEQNLEQQRIQFEASFGDSASRKPFIFSKMVSDDVVGALYEYAFYHRIDMLMFVTHQRSFWDSILHKSITNEAISSSDLPILIIHSDGDMV